LRRPFFVRTLSLTDGRLLVLVMGELLRRRRRFHRVSAEKKWVATQYPPAITTTPMSKSINEFLKSMRFYLTDTAGM